jgi:hypothetical protein
MLEFANMCLYMLAYASVWLRMLAWASMCQQPRLTGFQPIGGARLNRILAAKGRRLLAMVPLGYGTRLGTRRTATRALAVWRR